jgi:hypothetical protein
MGFGDGAEIAVQAGENFDGARTGGKNGCLRRMMSRMSLMMTVHQDSRANPGFRVAEFVKEANRWANAGSLAARTLNDRGNLRVDVAKARQVLSSRESRRFRNSVLRRSNIRGGQEQRNESGSVSAENSSSLSAKVGPWPADGIVGIAKAKSNGGVGRAARDVAEPQSARVNSKWALRAWDAVPNDSRLRPRTLRAGADAGLLFAFGHLRIASGTIIPIEGIALLRRALPALALRVRFAKRPSAPLRIKRGSF